MKQRIITALILAPLVIAGIFFLPIQGVAVIAAAVTLLGFWEWTQFAPLRQYSRHYALLPAVILMVISAGVFYPGLVSGDLSVPLLILFSLATLWWVAASALAVTYPKTRTCWQNSTLLKQLFGFLTLLPFMWSIIVLKAQSSSEVSHYGAKLVLFVCLLVWAADSGAYFVGKRWGRNKMAPNVSPNKTIEGLLGGVLAAGLVGVFVSHWFELSFSSYGHLILTIVFTVVISVLGDLVESMFKRNSGIKDSSQLIPGHGGVLDRIDSLTAAFPIFTLAYLVF
ncbi:MULTISPECIES: phosphatidate cytidylyltransferase [unclassified Vibrio]|uniref:Phosphatidate cytidylyltransferase n=1 Tax=Vibrio sp. HB236076 TaxID=3232307 RepID=A0AB39HGM7_9VIBR|nr:phosphatidate cytidylyltransferase [Vibrio sp. HB161653]MDP5254855.1 phosphatidate cytidylyltransferase [Vibrio sp. HB161653]